MSQDLKKAQSKSKDVLDLIASQNTSLALIAVLCDHSLQHDETTSWTAVEKAIWGPCLKLEVIFLPIGRR